MEENGTYGASLPLLPGSLCLGVLAPDEGLIYVLNRTKMWFLEFTFFGI